MSAPCVRDLLDQATTRLPGCDTARLDCEILLSTVLDKPRSWLYSHPEYTLDASQLADITTLLARRREQYPIAYLVGQREFWSLTLKVTADTLIPRPETELLVETALAELPAAAEVLDLGTGSGAIAIALASERPDIRVTAVDVSRGALAVATENARSLDLANLRLLHSDWFTALGGRHFDVIVSNPPYVSSADIGFIEGEIRHEPRLALDAGATGLDAVRVIIPSARQHLKPGGYIYIEHGHDQGERIRELFRHHHYESVRTLPDLAGHERLTRARLPA